MASFNLRYNALLQALADVMDESEGCLRAAKSGCVLERGGELATRLRGLEKVVNNVMERDGISEEINSLKETNSGRREVGSDEVETTANSDAGPLEEVQSIAHSQNIDLELGRVGETTAFLSFSSFRPTWYHNNGTPMTIHEIVRGRREEVRTRNDPNLEFPPM